MKCDVTGAVIVPVTASVALGTVAPEVESANRRTNVLTWRQLPARRGSTAGGRHAVAPCFRLELA